MTKQTNPHAEDTRYAELANQDEVDATREQFAEDLFVYAVEILAVLAIIAVLVFGE